LKSHCTTSCAIFAKQFSQKARTGISLCKKSLATALFS
jgi:hypothetical protein